MGTLTVGPFGTYSVTEVISANAQTELLAVMDELLTLIPEPGVNSDGIAPPHPDFGMINPATAEKLRAEIDAIKTEIDAAPTS